MLSPKSPQQSLTSLCHMWMHFTHTQIENDDNNTSDFKLLRGGLRRLWRPQDRLFPSSPTPGWKDLQENLRFFYHRHSASFWVFLVSCWPILWGDNNNRQMSGLAVMNFTFLTGLTNTPRTWCDMEITNLWTKSNWWQTKMLKDTKESNGPYSQIRCQTTKLWSLSGNDNTVHNGFLGWPTKSILLDLPDKALAKTCCGMQTCHVGYFNMIGEIMWKKALKSTAQKLVSGHGSASLESAFHEPIKACSGPAIAWPSRMQPKLVPLIHSLGMETDMRDTRDMTLAFDVRPPYTDDLKHPGRAKAISAMTRCVCVALRPRVRKTVRSQKLQVFFVHFLSGKTHVMLLVWSKKATKKYGDRKSHSFAAKINCRRSQQHFSRGSWAVRCGKGRFGSPTHHITMSMTGGSSWKNPGFRKRTGFQGRKPFVVHLFSLRVW